MDSIGLCDNSSDFPLFTKSAVPLGLVLMHGKRLHHRSQERSIRCFSDPHIPELEVNTEIFGVNLCIQSKCGKMRTRKTQNMNTFRTAWVHFKRDIC